MEKVTGSRTYSGGEFGNIRPFKKQLLSLLTSRILYWEDHKDQTGFLSMEIASAGNLMWHPKLPDQPGLIQSSIEVAEKFWDDCCAHGHPIDFRVVRGLWPNCLAFDIYTWLTYKAYVSLRQHRHEISISWHMLKVQFGPQYKTLFQFRWKFLESWKLVSRLYPSVSLTEQEGKGIQLRFRRPSVISVGLPGTKHLKGQWEPRQRQLPLPPQS